MFCTGCGSPNQPHDQYCHHCGRQLNVAPLSQASSVKRTARWAIFLGVAALFFLFYINWSLASFQNVTEPIENQLESLRNGKIPEAYYEYTSHNFQSAMSLEQFRDYLLKQPSLLKHQKITFSTPEIQDQRAVVEGELLDGDGNKDRFTFYLYRQDDEWKIDRIESRQGSLEIPGNNGIITDIVPDILKRVEQNLSEIRKNSIAQAYENASAEFKEATSLEQFQAFINRFKALQEYDNYEVTNQVRHGQHAAVRLELTTDEGIVPVEYYLIDENGDWRIWSIQVMVPREQTPETSLMLEPVQKQISSLQTGNSESAYYDSSSQEFQRITPLTTFSAFMERFPIFSQFTSVQYMQPKIEESGGKLLVVLENSKNGSSATVEYTMGVEHGKWKIWGLRLVDFEEGILAAKLDDTTQIFLNLAKEQLEAIESGNFQNAYEEYTSAQFRQSTSYKTFEQFLQAYPFFRNHTGVTFGQAVPNNDKSVSLTSIFIDNNGKKNLVEYHFTEENNDWKIMRIQVLDPISSVVEAIPFFAKIIMGDEINPAGSVLKDSSLFGDPLKKIYVNIFINGSEGDVIHVTFRHIHSKSAIPPVSSSPLPGKGEYRTSFTFSPPPAGWPLGEYELDIISSSGKTAKHSFMIRGSVTSFTTELSGPTERA